MECAACGRASDSPRTSEGIAAHRVTVDIADYGSTRRVTYRYRGLPFTLALCEDCYRMASRKRATRYAVILLALLLLPVTPMLLGLGRDWLFTAQEREALSKA